MIINGRFLTQKVTGVQRFARELVSAAAAQGFLGSNDPVAIPATANLSETNFAGLPVKTVGTHSGHVWEQIELPRAAGDECLANLCNAAPMFRRRQMVVLHDAATVALPQAFTPAYRLWYAAMIAGYGRFAKRIATVSRFSADEIASRYGISPKKIEIIPESGEHILRLTPDYSLHEKLGLEEGGYFLAASSMAAHKNFARLVEAAARLPALPFKFVIVGGRNTRVFGDSPPKLEGVIEAGYVTDAQLRALYERAALFVYPSLYEGFGLPPLEAMACGCPVLAARAASLPDVCGDAAAYCDPHDTDDIARQIAALLQSVPRRAELREAGYKNTAQWTWAEAAKKFHEIMRAL